MSEVIRLKNVDLIIHACVDALDLRRHIDDGHAIVSVDNWDAKPLRINGKIVTSYDEIPRVIENGRLEIMSEDATIELLIDDKICIGFTDGEYAYIPCFPVKHVRLLLKHARKTRG